MSFVKLITIFNIYLFNILQFITTFLFISLIYLMRLFFLLIFLHPHSTCIEKVFMSQQHQVVAQGVFW